MTYRPEEHGALCGQCPLNKKTVVPPSPAKTKVRLVVIGEGPGRNEELAGKPFVGPSGRLVDTIFGETGLSRDEAHVTNATLCACDEDMATREMTAPQLHERAVACCAPRLAKEIAEVTQGDTTIPLLPLGKWASFAILGQKQILKIRGYVWDAPVIDDKKVAALRRAAVRTRVPRRKLRFNDNATLLEARKAYAGYRVFPAVHPAFILRGADGWRPTMRRDFRRVARWLESKGQLTLADEVPFVVCRTARHLRQELSKLDAVVGLDLETDGVDPMRCNIECIGIADTKRGVVAYPWRRPMAKVLGAALKKRTAVTHNGPAFDQIILKRYGVEVPKLEDTLIAHHTFAAHLPQSLSHVASMYCDARPWKILAKASAGSSSTSERGFAPVKKTHACGQCGVCDACKNLLTYQAADAHIQVLCWHGMQADLADEIKAGVYTIDMRSAAICHDMQMHGMYVDGAQREMLLDMLEKRATSELQAMRELAGPAFNPNKPIEVRKALFGRFHAPVMKITAKGFRSTSADVLDKLQALETKGGRLAGHIVNWREANKLSSTFLGEKLVVNPSTGAIHPSWRSFGTTSGRWGCRGPNLMNLPRNPEVDIRRMYIPRPGCRFVYFDLGQAEARLAAYMSGDKQYIAAIESGDPYLAIAKVLFPFAKHLFEADASTLDDKSKKMRKNLRQIAKKTMLAAQYWVSPISLLPKLISDPDLRGMTQFLSLDAVEGAVDVIHRMLKEYFEWVNQNWLQSKKTGHFRDQVGGRIRWLGYFPDLPLVANAHIQQGIASVMNERLPQMVDKMPEAVHLVAQVHDSATFEVPEAAVGEVVRVIREAWQKPIQLVSGRSFVMPIDTKAGSSWSDKDLKAV